MGWKTGQLLALTASLFCLDGAGHAGPIEEVQNWVAFLSPDEQARALRAFADAERKHVNWFPGVRAGLPLQAMSERARTATFELLRKLVSPAGYAAIEAVLGREAILRELERAPEYRDPTKYYLAIFGQPGLDAWALRFEGHHLSLNLTYRGEDLLSTTPLFLGSNPDATTAQRAGFLQPLLDLAAEIAGPGRQGAVIQLQDLPERQQAQVRQILDFYYAVGPAPTRSRLETNLARRLRSFSYQNGDIAVEGDGIHFFLQRQARLHFHSLLRDDQVDFGGI